MVAEWVRASYLIDVLPILKVEGSNPGVAVYFRVNGNVQTRTIIPGTGGLWQLMDGLSILYEETKLCIIIEAL